ncbi:riboflavin synthase [Candidatus Bipolaricaulota bacterium]|nr:riboflavin synthase [Candidatus Bipolaricaulota bacterium]
MFTGIIIDMGIVKERRNDLLGVRSDQLSNKLVLGASIAVNGVCLTVTEIGKGSFRADLSRETVRRTTLGDLHPGQAVNLELPLTLERGIDGHLVLGHVDTMGKVVMIEQQGKDRLIKFSYPCEFSRYLVEKGSVAIDGISLTPFALSGETFTCGVVAETLSRTNLAVRKVGERVNIEFDILGKYIQRMRSDVH